MKPSTYALVPSAIALAAGVLLCAPVAAADTGTFLDELQTNGVWLPDKNLDQVIDAGYGVCGDLRNGMPVLDEMSRVESLYRFDQGTLFVSAATTHLCPDFAC